MCNSMQPHSVMRAGQELNSGIGGLAQRFKAYSCLRATSGSTLVARRAGM